MNTRCLGKSMQHIKGPKVNILIILSTKADASSVPGPELGSQSGGPGPRDEDWLRRDSAMPKAGKPSRPMCRRKTSHDKRERGLGTMASLQTGTYGEERSIRNMQRCGAATVRSETQRERRKRQRGGQGADQDHTTQESGFYSKGWQQSHWRTRVITGYSVRTTVAKQEGLLGGSHSSCFWSSPGKRQTAGWTRAAAAEVVRGRQASDGFLNQSAQDVLTDVVKDEAGEMGRTRNPKGPTWLLRRLDHDLYNFINSSK